MQTRLGSFIESLVNIVIGYSLNLLVNAIVFPLVLHRHVTARENIELGVIYTVVSIARSYAIRRWFNRWIMARLERAGV